MNVVKWLAHAFRQLHDEVVGALAGRNAGEIKIRGEATSRAEPCFADAGAALERHLFQKPFLGEQLQKIRQ